MSLHDKKYIVIRKILSKELAKVYYDYMINKEKTCYTLINNGLINPFSTDYGFFNDTQVPNSYSLYGDQLFDNMMIHLKPRIEKETGLELTEMYSYARNYRQRDELKRHKDRFSCEISTTMNLGGDDWPIYLSPNENVGPPDGKNITVASEAKGVKVDLKPGDMLVYRGVDLEHWREKFKGTECVQVFLHYNNRKTPGAKNNMFDARPHLGLPSWFKRN